MKNPFCRRQALNERVNEPEQLDRTPVELPLGTRRETKSIAEQIQDQIAIQLAKKQTGADQQTPDQILAELNDLDDPGPEHPYSQFEYVEMQDELVPGIDIPEQTQEAETNQESVEDSHSDAPLGQKAPESSEQQTHPDA